MTVVTRFAPSPTGVLHTGSARTALFNWLFAKKHGGKFYLRIEDTDQERSKPEYTKAILENLKWLGIDYDDEVIYQLSRSSRHQEVAKEMINLGKAYYCYSTQEEIEKFRENNPFGKFVSPWREKNAELDLSLGNPVVRLKVNHDGQTNIKDLIQGDITIQNSELDDMVMLRSDGTPTYMLAVVVDDHDMGITHIIRGDDHLTNAFRQKQIYDAMGWNTPYFAHIPLIHDKNGKKLSKREGALGVDSYEALGYLPEAVVNHLLRLGWSHGDDEIISREQAKEWFDLDHVGKSPARFDLDKLNFINAHYMREMDQKKLFEMLQGKISDNYDSKVYHRIEKGIEGLRQRSHTLIELAENAEIYVKKKSELDDKSKDVLAKGGLEIKDDLLKLLEEHQEWTKDSLHKICEEFALSKSLKFPLIMQTLRALVLGTFAAPGIFEVMEVLGQEETIARIKQ